MQKTNGITEGKRDYTQLNATALKALLTAFYQDELGAGNIPIAHINRLADYLADQLPAKVKLEQTSSLTPEQILEWADSGKLPKLERSSKTEIPWAERLPDQEDKVTARDVVVVALIMVFMIVVIVAFSTGV